MYIKYPKKFNIKVDYRSELLESKCKMRGKKVYVKLKNILNTKKEECYEYDSKMYKIIDEEYVEEQCLNN